MISAAKKKVDVDDWLATVAKPEYKAQGMVKGDLSMINHSAVTACTARILEVISALNNTLHKDQVSPHRE